MISRTLRTDTKPSVDHHDLTKNIVIDSESGDTLLHLAVKQCVSAEEIVAFIDHLDSAIVHEMATTVNNAGLIPGQIALELLEKKSLDEREAQTIANLLYFSFTLPTAFKKMSEPVAFSDVNQRYHPVPGSHSYRYLQLACQVATETRQAFSYSSTHPDSNGDFGIASDKLKRSNDDFSAWRNEASVRSKEIIANHVEKNENSDLENHTLYKALLENAVKISTEKSTANCEEQGYYVLKRFYEIDKKIPVGLYGVSKGDHLVAVIDPDGLQILCDPWAGVVCLGYDIARELKTHLCISGERSNCLMMYNLVTSFNPVYHEIYPIDLFGQYKQPYQPIIVGVTSESSDTVSIVPALIDALHSGDQSVLCFLLTTTAGFRLLSNVTVRNSLSDVLLNAIIQGDQPLSPVFILVSTSIGIKILDVYPDVCAKINESSLNAIIPVGRYKNWSAVSFLTGTEEGRELLDRDALLRKKISGMALNHLEENGRSPLTSLVSTTSGCDLLDRHEDLRCKISETGLNAIETEGVAQGASAISYLMFSKSGRALLLKYPDLCHKINEQGLNALEETAEYRYASPLIYMMKDALGYEILSQYPTLVEKITARGLNTLCLAKNQKNTTLLGYLCRYSEGFAILLQHPDLIKKIDANALNQVGSVNSSGIELFPALYLLGSIAGRRLLLKHPELALMINEESMNAVSQDSAFKGLTPACLLASQDEGQQLLSLYPQLLDKVTAQGLNTIVQLEGSHGDSTLLWLLVSDAGRQCLFSNARIRSLISETTLFSVANSAIDELNGKCAADLLLQPTCSHIFELLDRQLQHKILDYQKTNMVLSNNKQTLFGAPAALDIPASQNEQGVSKRL